MLTPLLLLAAGVASAIPSTGDYDCEDLTLSPGSGDACFCVFEATAADWINSGDTLNETGTCFEFTSNINGIAPGYGGARAKWLERMDLVAFPRACTTGRTFEDTTYVSGTSTIWIDKYSGLPDVQSQVLDTMGSGDTCGVGVGAGEWADVFWDEETQTWGLLDAWTQELALKVNPREGHELIKAVHIWDWERDLDEVYVYWDDARIWVVEGPVDPEDTVEEPEEPPPGEEEEPPCDPERERYCP